MVFLGVYDLWWNVNGRIILRDPQDKRKVMDMLQKIQKQQQEDLDSDDDEAEDDTGYYI